MGKTIKGDIKAKKKAIKAKLAARKKQVKAKFGVASLVALLAFVSGCALERADPAARSNRATYTISVVAREGSTATAYITDGLMASADGAGAVKQPSTLTTTQSPELTVPGDAVSAGIQAASHLVGKGIDAYTASKQASAAQASAAAKCAKGACTDGSCVDCKDCVDCE